MDQRIAIATKYSYSGIEFIIRIHKLQLLFMRNENMYRICLISYIHFSNFIL